MSLKRKVKTVAGNQVVENTLHIETANYISNDPEFEVPSPNKVPTQLAVMSYVQNHGKEAILYGTEENPTDKEIALHAEVQGIVINEGDTFLYVQTNLQGVPINSKRLTYNGLSLSIVTENKSYFVSAETDYIDARHYIGTLGGSGFTKDLDTGGSGIFTANNANNTHIAYIDTHLTEQTLGQKYRVTFTTANQQNSNGMRLKIYTNTGLGIDDETVLTNAIVGTSNGTHTQTYTAAATSHWIVFYGNNTTLNVTSLDVDIDAAASGHTMEVILDTSAAVTYTYETLNERGLNHPGVVFTVTNDNVATTDPLELSLFRPRDRLGISSVTVRVTATYPTQITVGSSVETITATKQKDFHLRVEN